MQLQIDVNNAKSTFLLDLLSVLKKEKMINSFKILSGDSQPRKMTEYEKELLADLEQIGDAVRAAERGEGKKSGMKVSLDQ